MDFSADLAKQRRKNSWGGFEVSKNDFWVYFFLLVCLFSSFQFILSTLSSNMRDRQVRAAQVYTVYAVPSVSASSLYVDFRASL